MNKKLFSFRLPQDFDEDLEYLQKKLKAKSKGDTLAKAVKKLLM